MPSELLYTPPAEAQWVNLIDPKPGYDPKKELQWSFDLLFPSTHQILTDLEQQFTKIHGDKPRSTKTPWKPHKNREGITAIRFKALQLKREDGTFIDGPRIVDSQKQPWRQGDIGNGSILRACYIIYKWAQPDGVGITLIPKSVQVLKFVPISDGSEGFEKDENGYAQEQEQEAEW